MRPAAGGKDFGESKEEIMALWHKAAGILLALLALAVAVNMLAWEFYGDITTAPVHLVWDVLNGFMAGGIIIALIYQGREKRRQDRANGGVVSYAYLATNLLLLATILLAIWFFRNWLAGLSGIELVERHSFVWQLVNGLFVVIMAATAGRLLGSRQPAAAG